MSGEELWLRDVIDMAYEVLGARAAREGERAPLVECPEDDGSNE